MHFRMSLKTIKRGVVLPEADLMGLLLSGDVN